ncbi:MAG: YggS family pyridoxal phosphate-dependent enzyme [Candidatus Dormibacteria bacterium]
MSQQPPDDLVLRRLASIRERVGRAAQRAGRDPDGVRLLAVTKGHPAGAIEAAVSLGLRDIGESRVQEARAKRAAIQLPGVCWHMIGHLQRNKATQAAALFDVVQSVDSPALARALARHRDASAPRLQVFIEVELTGLPGRTGVPASDAADLLNVVLGLTVLEPVGLMTIAPAGGVEAAGRCFARLRAIRDALRESHGVALDELSMGMSDDFDVAIAHGATLIRLGRALFGERPGGGP